MKMLTKILFVVLLSLQMITAQDCKSTVKINTPQSDLLIFIDNEYKGNGNIEVELNEGVHKVKLKEPGLRWNARSVQKEISINNCEQNYDFTFELEEEYLLETNPADVCVYVYDNDTLLGNTPLLISKKIETIELEKEDYKSRRLNLSGVSLQNPVSLEYTGELSELTASRKAKSFTDTPFFEILIGTAVGFGAVAAYYKIQADQSFDKYEETNEQKYLDETNRFDNISGIAFGALQINFGALIYFLLSD